MSGLSSWKWPISCDDNEPDSNSAHTRPKEGRGELIVASSVKETWWISQIKTCQTSNVTCWEQCTLEHVIIISRKRHVIMLTEHCSLQCVVTMEHDSRSFLNADCYELMSQWRCCLGRIGTKRQNLLTPSTEWPHQLSLKILKVGVHFI